AAASADEQKSEFARIVDKVADEYRAERRAAKLDERGGEPERSEFIEVLHAWRDENRAAARAEQQGAGVDLVENARRAPHEGDARSVKATIASGLRGGARKPFVWSHGAVKAQPLDVAGGAAPVPPQAASLSRRKMWTARELVEAEFPEPRWAVPGLVPEGLS